MDLNYAILMNTSGVMVELVKHYRTKYQWHLMLQLPEQLMVWFEIQLVATTTTHNNFSYTIAVYIESTGYCACSWMIVLKLERTFIV